MKRNIIILTGIILTCLLAHRYLAYGSTSEKEYKVYEEIVYELLSSRTSIMNRGLYSDEDINNIFSDLEEIERGRLLEEDIDCLRDVRANPTDYPSVSDLKILKVDVIALEDNIYKLKVLTQWKVIEAKESRENIEYLIEIQQQEGRYFLIKLEPVE
ncbi:hypothetical protein [Proteiniborus sp. MB09-C3]|uniref:hypothetical protein n=1 Tax=Proteiniborus sp. MB09-C3 TaxID=3050072 RepID=UPI002555295B|nr:hypothetical protein [Proteiniborus sp. MB09-C3]WIV10507.1 hypothetical protein QO263_10065 [Proteiniborus sp. MB09-C3]